MLQKIDLGSISLSPHAYFYDKLNNQLYFLTQGQLASYHLTTQQTKTIHIHASTAPSIHPRPNTLTPISGEIVANVHKNVVSASSDEAVLRGSVQIVDGSSWQWHAPISLQKIKLGICHIEENEEVKYEFFDFNSSTSRTVSFSVHANQLSVLVNGYPPNKNSTKTITYDSNKNKWYPCAKFSEKGNTLLYAPLTFNKTLSLQAKYNLIFGKNKDQPSVVEVQVPLAQRLQYKIEKLVQLNKDSFIVIWQNNAARLFQRSKKSGRFEFLSFSVHQNTVYDIFTPNEHALLTSWIGQNGKFGNETAVNLPKAYKLIKSLVQSYCSQKQPVREDILSLLVTRLAVLRPYLLASNISAPDVTPLLDNSSFNETIQEHLKYDPSFVPITSIRSNTQFKLQGTFLDISQNYLVTKNQNTIILYNINNSITEIFRETVDQKLLFSKRAAAQNYDEQDIRNLKNQGSFLYKILSSCLQKGKKSDEPHAVNENDVKELIRDYGIDEKSARQALEQTGHVEQALVWIFTDKQDGRGKRSENQKEVQSEKVSSVHLIELHNIFARILLQVGNRLFVLGILPNQVRNWCYKGEKQYIDLLTFKHEDDLNSLQWKSWYSGSRHPHLHILDQIELDQIPNLLYKEGQKYSIILQRQKQLSQKKVSFNADLLYEPQDCLTLSQATPLQIKCENISKTVKGQLITRQVIGSNSFLNDTVWGNGNQIFSNIASDSQSIATVSLKLEETIQQRHSKASDKNIPFIVDSSPPGCSSNYSVTSMLHPKSSFLANYPSKIILRHLHNKLINLTNFTLHRSSQRKNVNYIKEGEIFLFDSNGIQSKRIHFEFEKDQNEKEIKVQIDGYWKYVVLQPQFTQVRKLPYQYGFISLKGHDATDQEHHNEFIQKLTPLLHQKINKPLTIISWRRVADRVQARIQLQGQLQQAEEARLVKELNYRNDVVASAQQIAQNREVAFLKPAEVIKLLTPSSNHIESILRSISRSTIFSLGCFSKTEVFKFIDLTLYYTGSLLNIDQFFSNIFKKIWENQFGKQYLSQLSRHLSQFPTIPFPYLKLLLQQLDTNQHLQTIQSLLCLLPSIRTHRYNNLDPKYSHLLFQTQFYSDYYVNLIQPNKENKQELFSEPFIESEFIAIKDQNSRRIIVKLSSQYRITNYALRVERCQQASRVKYRVYALNQQGKKQIGSGVILEHQWAQISREIYKQNNQEQVDDIKTLNIYGLTVEPTTTQYLEIELLFTETGIISHQSESIKIPQVDIIPELYGYPTSLNSKIQQYESIFLFNPQEMFFLSVSSLGSTPLHKYSVSKGKQTQCLYFKTQRQEPTSFKSRIQQKIERRDFDSLINLQKKLISNTRSFSNKVCLDYVYTVLILSLNELEKRQIRLEESICKQLFELIVKTSQGPIKIFAFKALSKQTPLLIKSLQYVQQIFPTLGKLSFSYEQLLEVIDLNNLELCQTLTRLILRVVDYEPRWAELLIKMSAKTHAHQQIVKYFSSKDDWLDNHIILQYIAAFSDQFFQNTFLTSISYYQLSKLVTKKISQSRIELLLQVIVQQASEKCQVDLDVVSLIFQQPEVRWQQLEKVVACCAQATDTVIHQFLQAEDPQIALQHYQLLTIAATNPKYSEEFAIFINKIFIQSKQAFRDVVLSIIGKCTSLHYDCLQTISQFIFTSCNFGGIEGVKLLSETQLYNLQVGVQSLKILEKVPEGAQISNQESFIQWYLNNNDYQESNRNPANKSPAYHLIRQLVDLVKNILKCTSPSKVLAKYSHLVQQLQNSRKISLFRKHLLFNQLHHGATQLLSHTLTPGSLAEVLVGQNNPVLSTVINELKSSIIKEGSKKIKWLDEKQIDITEKFELKSVQAKDLQGGKSGNRSPIAKIAISQRSLRLQSTQTQWPSKFVIGFCLNDHADNKNAILPSKVELFGGNSNALFKVGELKLIEDQFYLSFGIKIFAINLNTVSSLGSSSVKNLEVRLFEPSLSSASQILQNGQRSKKGATYNISFININGYDSLPSQHPDYSQLYVTLLGFLGQPKYHSDLKKVIASELFDQKLQLIIQVLNDLLPNESIQNLLLTLNKQGQNILEHILRSKGANSRLISKLILGKLTKDNINKLLTYTLSNLTQEYVSIVTMSIRLASYSSLDKQSLKAFSDFTNIQKLIEKYQNAETSNKRLYYQIIVALLSVPNLYHYDLSKLIELVWNSPQKSDLYSILAAVLPYYNKQIQLFTSNDYTTAVFNELIQILQQNKNAEEIIKNPYNYIMLLNTLTASSSSRNLLITIKAPIKIVELLRSEKSLLQKYSTQVMKLFITFFQGTCIATQCQDQFSQILINLMTSLNNFDSIHHQFFIQNFFFPLINSFKGVPLFFVWKEKNDYVWQPTQVLKRNPIRSSSKVISYKGKFYYPIQALNQSTIKTDLIIALKQNNHILFSLKDNQLNDLQVNKKLSYTFAQNKLTITVGEGNNLILPNEKYTVYQQSQWEHQLLTNTTLINLHNPWILQDKYRSVLPIRQSTAQRCYFLPLQITLAEILKHINISGFKIHNADLPNIKISNYLTGKQLSQQLTLRKVLQGQNLPYLKIQVEASQLFKSTTIESLVQQQAVQSSFVPEETIFKAFEQKKGLEKLIGVLTGCVVNWVNKEQSKIWQQYLKQLQSYSCFPIFSSLYMTKQANVNLLFDLLFGLPDKQDSKKWAQKQKESVKELYAIVKDVFAVEGQQAITVRNYALKSGFYPTMLNRLHLITKEPKRQKVQNIVEEQEILAPSLEKKQSEQEYKAKLQKRKGVGYGTDSSTNQKWDVTGQQQARKDQSEQILSLLTILEKFLDYKGFDFPEKILEETYQSSLLPIIENSLRGGSLLQISKYAQLIQGELNFIQILAKSRKLLPTLLPLPKNYEPRQPQSLHSLLKTLANTSKIFLSCLTGSASQKVSQQIAKKIAATFEQVDEAVSEYEIAHNDEDQDRKILQLPLGKKYPILLKDLRFDYIDMKDSNGKISKHHYGSYYQVGHKSPVQKTVRLAQQLADVSHALPIDHTNAIFVRCDKERVDYMQALIMGSNGTPYGHGAYLFDIYFEDNYPNGPPKVNLTTTGNAQIRFNPNLYSCGKVCLSLLGTWRGSAMENWDSKVSTLLQVLVSIQSIIMSEDIYFNEPGFEHEQGTVEGEKKNQAYANIVRYGNVKFAMTDNIKNPPKGFETIIRRHFYLKKAQILQQCQKWLKLAEKRQASYNGLVSDHNYNWCNTFKKSKNQYKTMLQKAIKELEVELNKLPPPTSQDLKKENSPVKQKKKVKLEDAPNKQEPLFEQIDVSYGGETRENVQLDINDQKVKDRWSRYIGAMGVEAVSKQSKANILLLGMGGLGVEIAKNIVLSGCKQFAVWDDKQVKWQDLSGQFFLGQGDIGKPRLQSTIYKLQELNHYVKVSKFQYNINNIQNMTKFNVVIATEVNHQEQQKINQFCRNNKIHFVSADCYGPYGQLFNDFGEQFQIIDKNGQQTTQIILQDISNAQKGLVRVAKGLRHPFEDGETVRFVGVKGMKSIENKQQSINGTLHKVQVIDQYSFYIGNTLNYSPYEGDGTVRNIKTPLQLKFKSLKQSATLQNIDSNLQYYDFSKGANLRLLHHAFTALSTFKANNQRLPYNWNRQDASQLIQQVKKLKPELNDEEIKYLRLFSYTCSGKFGPIFALYGGIVSQEVFKAITGKYTPIHQYFLADFSQVVEQPPEDQQLWPAFVQARKSSNNDRRQGIKRVIGNQLLTKLQNSKVFMVGSGAIGCELLKNFAMLQIGTGQNGGSIVVTDPDHIQTSNLNRQFLFREKHLRKPKSATAAAVVTQMNPRLKGHIKARLDKVCQSTKDLFSNEFFEGLSIVTNALDNVQARRYVDSRCVENKVALLESGTLSSKGHVQVIIPYKTETYGSKQDPNDANGQVPHCTLKMFPEETLHCVQWARDLFGKDFTLSPKALAKLLQTEGTFVPGPSDIQMLKDCLKMLETRPTNFEQAAGTAAKVFYQLFKNDILQLLYTYPLDAKTKDGKPFWRLPKRPPTEIPQINPEDPLHATFISSYAVLLSKIHGIPYPKDFRDSLKRKEIAQISTKFKVEPFTPSDKVAKEMTEEVNNQNDKKQEGAKQAQQTTQQGENELFDKFKQVLSQLKEGGQTLASKAQEFQKDQDQNGHIDLIYSMANLRARNYKLEQMEWINVKLKAGRIMPALSTTTSCIAALQTIELVKYIKGCKVDQMRNAFINLAVPLLQLGEPGQVEKIKVHQKLETSIWERWQVSSKKEQTLRDLIGYIEAKYGVSVKGLNLSDGGQIYSDIVLGLQSKKQEKEKLLSKQLKQILSQEIEQQTIKFVDFTLLMSVNEQLVKHAPTLRLTFQ